MGATTRFGLEILQTIRTNERTQMDAYQPPIHSEFDRPAKKSRTSFRRLSFVVACVITCGVFVRFFGAEHFKFVGNPDGKGIAFGFGGLVGLLIARLVLVFWKRSNDSDCGESEGSD